MLLLGTNIWPSCAINIDEIRWHWQVACNEVYKPESTNLSVQRSQRTLASMPVHSWSIYQPALIHYDYTSKHLFQLGLWVHKMHKVSYLLGKCTPYTSVTHTHTHHWHSQMHRSPTLFTCKINYQGSSGVFHFFLGWVAGFNLL